MVVKFASKDLDMLYSKYLKYKQNILFGKFAFMLFCFLFMLLSTVTAQTRYQIKAKEFELQGEYSKAIEFYKRDTVNKENQQSIAKCYKKMNNLDVAELWYAKFIDSLSSAPLILEYAEILAQNENCSLVEDLVEPLRDDSLYADKALRILTICDNVSDWNTNTSNYEITNLYSINSPYDDWGQVMTNKTKMFFVSNRPAQVQDSAKGAEVSRMYFTQDTLPKANKNALPIWAKPELSPFLNEKGVHVGPMTVAVQNGEAFVCYTKSASKKQTNRVKLGREIVRQKVQKLEVYTTQLDDRWKFDLRPFMYNNAKEYSIMHPFLSADGRQLFFSSDMPGGYGGLDIWRCQMDDANSWGAPQNMGSYINTSSDEVFPTMDKEGILYFSSNGHEGIGGLDIFSVKENDGQWSEVENLKPPFNSTADDFYFIKSADSIGYFSSNRAGGRGGDDIYMFSPLNFQLEREEEPIEEEIEEEVELMQDTIPQDTVLIDTIIPEIPFVAEVDTVVEVKKMTVDITGRIVDRETKAPISMTKICATEVAVKSSNCMESGEGGEFAFTVKPNVQYMLSAFKSEYQSSVPIRLVLPPDSPMEDFVLEMVQKEVADFMSAEEAIDQSGVRQRNLAREYRIQILASWRDTDHEYFDRLRSTYPQFVLNKTKRDKATRFTYGTFVDVREARRYLRLFIELGYSDSFIAVFEYGKQIESIYYSGSRDKVKKKKKH
ncbi:MAG: hypothetical protein ACRC3G_02525 [Bacteroidales bacterium]